MCKCKKTKCLTKQCGCRKNDIICTEECDCYDCENSYEKSHLDSTDDEPEDLATNKHSLGTILDINQLAQSITEKVRVTVSHKKNDVFEYRDNLDIYTNKKKNLVENPQVDHIVEDQIVAHAVARTIRSNQAYEPYIQSLKDALNIESLDNYNVTFGQINGSKGSIIKNYLRDKINTGYPLRSMIKPESHFGRYIEPIFQAMNDTHQIVEEYVREGRRSDGNVTGSQTFEKIADNLAKIFEDMDLSLEECRKLRSHR